MSKKYEYKVQLFQNATKVDGTACLQLVSEETKIAESDAAIMQMFKMPGIVAKIIAKIPVDSHDSASKDTAVLAQPKANVEMRNGQFIDITTKQPATTHVQTCATRSPSTQPRFFRVGDVELKDVNGQLFQQQWMRVSPQEERCLRIVNDKNNSIVSLNGKHIEIKKWMPIKTSESDTSEGINFNE